MGCESKRKGDACEAHMLAVLVDADLRVWKPWGDNNAADLAVQIGRRFLRIQCKTGRLTGNGCVTFNTYRVARKPIRSHYMPGEFEYYGVWCRPMGSAYLVPFEETGGAWMPHLRVELPLPGSTGGRQRSGVHWANKYEARVVIEGWLRTGGDFDPIWAIPILTPTGELHPHRRRRMFEA